MKKKTCRTPAVTVLLCTGALLLLTTRVHHFTQHFIHQATHHGGLHSPPASVDCHAQHLLTFQGFGRLGNQMFRYASSYGIARHNNRRLVLPSSRHELHAIFLLASDSLVCGAEDAVNVSDGTWQSVGGDSCGGAVYDDSLLHLPPSHNIIVHGYLSSWKYFAAYAEDLQEHFRFRPRAAHIMLAYITPQPAACTLSLVSTQPGKLYTALILDLLRVANQLLRPLSDMCVCVGTSMSMTSAMKCRYVGVHVRTGDFQQAELVEVGFVPANIQFIERAMTYYCQRLGTSVRLTFIVCGDDLAWNRKNVHTSSSLQRSRSQRGSLLVQHTPSAHGPASLLSPLHRHLRFVRLVDWLPGRRVWSSMTSPSLVRHFHWPALLSH
jgi:hypothetical protein